MEAENNKESMEQAMQKIWSIFELLKRSSKMNSVTEQTEITLLLLSLYKDGLITSEFLENPNIINEPFLPYGLNVYDDNTYEAYRKTVWEMTSYLSGIDDYLFRQISFTLFEIDKTDLRNNFSYIFDSILYQSARLQGKFGAEYVQKPEINQLIAELANLTGYEKIFNPFAGVASYAVFQKHYLTYFGQEISSTISTLANLRLLAYGKQSNSLVECQNSITQWPDESQKFDLIISTPPFGMRLNHMDLPLEMENIRSVEEFLLIKGYRSLSPKGKMIVVVPRGFLSSGLKSSLEVRKNLIKKDALEMVISLPTGIFYSTNIATSIIVINKNKSEADVVKFVNAEDCYTVRNNIKKLDTQSILSQTTSDIDSNIAKTTSIYEIKENGFNLNPNIYFKNEIIPPKGFEIRELRDVLSVIKRNTNHNDSVGRYVQISDLANDIFNYERTFDDISDTSLKKNTVKLNKNALLISRISLNLKPTHFVKSTDYPIYLSLNIDAFEIKDKSVIMPYLIHELYEDYFQEQLNSFVSGSVIASVSTENFLSCKIFVSSLEKQKAIVNESRKQIILEKEKELKALKEKFEQQTYEEFASLKHALGKPIPGINTALEYIYEYLKKNQGEKLSLSDVVSKRRETTLQDKFDVVFNGLKLIQTLLEKGEKGLVVEDYELTSIKLGQLIKDFCNSYTLDKFTITYSDNNKEFEQLEVLANKELVTVLLNDVLSNANNHAFKITDIENNKVDIYLSVEDNLIELWIANNGIPFPKNFDKSKFIQKYQKAGKTPGEGIGGYDINRIVNYFGGFFDILTKPWRECNTAYLFKFPIMDIKEDNHE